MHSLSSHVFIKNEINLLQDVEVNKLLFVDGKMIKKREHIYFWAIVPFEEAKSAEGSPLSLGAWCDDR